MSNKSTVGASWLIMLVVQTIGTITPTRKLPAPKQYVAVTVLWSVFFLLVDTGYARLSARLSMLTVLTSIVVGPFGKRLLSFLEFVAKNFATAPPTGTGTTAAPAGPTVYNA